MSEVYFKGLIILVVLAVHLAALAKLGVTPIEGVVRLDPLVFFEVCIPV